MFLEQIKQIGISPTGRHLGATFSDGPDYDDIYDLIEKYLKIPARILKKDGQVIDPAIIRFVAPHKAHDADKIEDILPTSFALSQKRRSSNRRLSTWDDRNPVYKFYKADKEDEIVFRLDKPAELFCHPEIKPSELVEFKAPYSTESQNFPCEKYAETDIETYALPWRDEYYDYILPHNLERIEYYDINAMIEEELECGTSGPFSGFGAILLADAREDCAIACKSVDVEITGDMTYRGPGKGFSGNYSTHYSSRKITHVKTEPEMFESARVVIDFVSYSAGCWLVTGLSPRARFLMSYFARTRDLKQKAIYEALKVEQG